MATVNDMEASIRAVLETAMNHGMSFHRAIKVVNDAKYYTTILCSFKLISLVSDSVTRQGRNIDTSYIDNEDDENPGRGGDGTDEEEAGEEAIEPITTPGTGSLERKALNFIPDSSTPSKSKNMYYMSSLILSC
jgi:hypothetical protein